ncbi:hypothetical protein RJ498_000420 [Pluralibacter gergoviae]
MSTHQNESAMLELIDAFTSGHMTAPCFEQKYAAAWRAYRDASRAKEVDIGTQRFFDSVFSSLDSYCSDPTLIDEGDLNDEELLSEVSRLQTGWKNAPSGQ